MGVVVGLFISGNEPAAQNVLAADLIAGGREKSYFSDCSSLSFSTVSKVFHNGNGPGWVTHLKRFPWRKSQTKNQQRMTSELISINRGQMSMFPGEKTRHFPFIQRQDDSWPMTISGLFNVYMDIFQIACQTFLLCIQHWRDYCIISFNVSVEMFDKNKLLGKLLCLMFVQVIIKQTL